MHRLRFPKSRFAFSYGLDVAEDRREMAVKTILKIVARALTIYYNVKIGLYLLWNVLTKGPGILSVKQRKEKPQVLLGEFKDQTVLINGLNLHYVEAGDRKNHLMLFVHGFPEFWFSWRYQLREFSKDHWVVAVDLRGYNESDKPEGEQPYLMENMVSDVHELIKHLGKKPTLVCHDWGSIIGFEYVLRHMDSVRDYVMLCAPPKQIHRQGKLIPELLLRSFDLRIFQGLKSQSVSKEDIEAFKYVFAEEGAFTPPINYYRANISNGSADTQMPSNFKKGLLLLAEKDKFISTKCGPATEKLIPNCKYRLMKNVDHFCLQTDPEIVNQEIRRFLEERR